MMKKLTFLGLTAALLSAVACSSHYRLTDVSRERIVIDSRYDRMPDAEAAAFLAPYKHVVDSVMGPVQGTVAHNMTSGKPEGDLPNLLADILLWAGEKYGEKPAFAVQNIGGVRADLTKGEVTYGDILAVAPFENKICFLTLTGRKVTELFQQIAGRGGEAVSHGVELVITSDRQLVSARVNGQEIDPDGRYRIATIDYLAQGNDGLTAFQSGTDVHAPKADSDNTRFIIMDYFREQHAKGVVIDSKVEGRVKMKD
jgi:2',3'-cyclic-nucleotide 2'-phosphodiesterase (5'-nucleotidase family)